MNKKFLIGLGNPGAKYQNTYHNAGRLFVDRHLENTLRAERSSRRPKFQKPRASGNFEYCKTAYAVFVRPLVFMNESGIAVRAALKFFNAAAEDFLVIHDDSDIGIGDYKLSFDRGSAGHGGAASIIRELGTKRFWRLRIGVRRASTRTAPELMQEAKNGFPRRAAQREKAGSFVLRQTSKSDRKILDSAFREIENEFFRKNEASLVHLKIDRE